MIIYNLNNFKNRKTNICFVTGLSASGKTTLSKKIAKKYGYIHIDLDNFEPPMSTQTLDDIKIECGEVFYIYFSKHKELYNRLRTERINEEELYEEFTRFMDFVINYCKNDSKKYILEGIQIYSILKPSILLEHSFIIIDKSIIFCIYRKIKRNYRCGYIKKLSDLKLFHMIKFYNYEQKNFKFFLKKVLQF